MRAMGVSDRLATFVKMGDQERRRLEPRERRRCEEAGWI
jgi:hypothetical protein